MTQLIVPTVGKEKIKAKTSIEERARTEEERKERRKEEKKVRRKARARERAKTRAKTGRRTGVKVTLLCGRVRGHETSRSGLEGSCLRHVEAVPEELETGADAEGECLRQAPGGDCAPRAADGAVRKEAGDDGP